MGRFLRLFVVLCLLSVPAFAWPPTYGVEFTFTNKELIKGSDAIYDPKEEVEVETEENAEARDRMADVLRRTCRQNGCTVRELEDKYGLTSYRVTYTDGWYFDINTDPYVVEIQTKPGTLAEFKRNQTRMERDIFGVAKKCKLYPDWDQGGGHIHIGVASAFKQSPLLFRNFVADFLNHVELPLGIMDDSIEDATPFARLPSANRKAFARILGEWDAGKIPTIERFSREIQEEVYSRNIEDVDDFWEISRNMAMNLNRIADREMTLKEKTIELRAVRTHLSAELFLRIAELFEARLNYLVKLDAPIVFVDRGVPGVPERLGMFRQYITECGLNPDDYAFIIPPKWRAQFLKAKAAASCATQLSLNGYAGPRAMTVREHKTAGGRAHRRAKQ